MGYLFHLSPHPHHGSRLPTHSSRPLASDAIPITPSPSLAANIPRISLHLPTDLLVRNLTANAYPSSTPDLPSGHYTFRLQFFSRLSRKRFGKLGYRYFLVQGDSNGEEAIHRLFRKPYAEIRGCAEGGIGLCGSRLRGG